MKKNGSTAKAILSFVSNKYDSGNPNDPFIRDRDVYNELSQMRAEELGNKTPIQALNVRLQNNSDM